MTITASVNKIRSFYEQDVAARLPYDSHPLKEVDDYKKQLYCTMLAVVVQYDNEPKREQLVLLERIAKGAGLELSVQELLQKAIVTDEKFAAAFYEEFVGSPLAQNFTVDAVMLLYAYAKVSEKQLAFVTEVVSVLDIAEVEFKMLLRFTKAVLMNSSEAIIALLGEQPQLTLLNQFAYYSASIIDTSIEQVNKLVESNQEVLIFVNMHITPRINFETISERKLVIFKNCTFSEFNKPIGLFNINSVILDSCVIKNCTWHVFELHYVENLMLSKCQVKNHEKKKHSEEWENIGVHGGLITSVTPLNIYVIDARFENIYLSATNTRNYATYASGIIYHGDINHFLIKDSHFINCSFVNTSNSTTHYFSERTWEYHPNEMFAEVSNCAIPFLKNLTFIQYVLENYALDLGKKGVGNNTNDNAKIDVISNDNVESGIFA